MKLNEQIHAYISEEELVVYVEAARKDDRSLSSWVRQACKFYAEKQRKQLKAVRSA